jgi:hypothetical protein
MEQNCFVMPFTGSGYSKKASVRKNSPVMEVAISRTGVIVFPSAVTRT